jgi:polysaccharide export outer membrane protein
MKEFLSRSMKTKFVRSHLLFFFVVTILGLSSAFGQTATEQLQRAAQERGYTLTGEQINKRLQEMGMTAEEATRRARERGISFEEFLQLPTATVTQPVDAMGQFLQQGRPIAPQLPPVVAAELEDSALALKLKEKLAVPGFAGRARVDRGLEPFGYEVFRLPPSLFEPVMNVATPPTYVLGPGDEVIVSVWGETKLYHQLIVNREGNVLIPDVGPVSAGGTTIQQFRDRLLRRMSSVYSGLQNGQPGANTFLDVSLGKLRTIQVFVLGDVVRPGGVQMSSMSTALHALYLAGGPNANGTMREIHVSRAGAKLDPIDLYDYLVKGTRASDIRIQDGDVVFVRPALRRVAVQGRVVRPAIYELKPGDDLGAVVKLAGGLRFDAYFNRVHIERIIPFAKRVDFEKNVQDINLDFQKVEELLSSPFGMEDGDVLTVRIIDDLPQNRVIISGNVKKPGPYQLRGGMRVKDLIMAADSLDRDSFLERGTLLRLLPNLRREVYEFNVREALAGNEKSNLELHNEDSLTIYKESQFYPQRQVSIAGAVRNPGRFPRYEKMTVADLVVLAGGLTENASYTEWEISRVETTQVGVFSHVTKLAVDSAYWRKEGNAAFELEDLDHVLVPTDPRITLPRVVDVQGHVMFPGTYSIRFDGEKISDVLKRAGGVKEGAYLLGSRFFRKRNNAGFVPIDIQEAMKDPIAPDNLVLVDQDSIYIPRYEELIYIRGEVFVPSPVLYKKGASLKYYIKQAGGYKDEADDGRTVVFLPTGKKWESGWFILPDPEILPGSAIFVPKKIEKEDKTLPLVRDLVTIVASLAAITVALVQVTK